MIVIAEAKSSNGRVYSEQALKDMATQLVGKYVMSREPDSDEVGARLDCLFGIVRAAEYGKDGKVRVAIDWFASQPKPVGKYLTPTGVGHIEYGKLVRYVADHLTVSDTSAFESAEKIA